MMEKKKLDGCKKEVAKKQIEFNRLESDSKDNAD
jgi:hypothetical protein